MKKILSLALAAVLLVSAVPMVYAADVDYTQGTAVTYTATGAEAYTVTVPAELAPGASGTVTLEGTWADNRTITVTADPTVTLTNSIKAEDQKVLNVHFDGISEAGSNTTSQTFTQGISVDGITDALFGTWSGKFNYSVSLDTNTAESSGLILRMDDVSDISHNPTITLSSDSITDFSSVSVTRTGKNLFDVNKLSEESKISNYKIIDATTNTIEFTKTCDANAGVSGIGYNIYLPAGTYYFTGTAETSDGKNAAYWVLSPYNSFDQIVQGTFAVNVPESRKTFTIEKSDMYMLRICGDYVGELDTKYTVSNMQLEYGQESEFEPFTSQTVKANADGTVLGINSISPSMTIFTDNDVTITCEYQKKTN